MPAGNASVIVAGAGPVGLTTAAVLAQEGVDVTVVDLDDGPIHQSRAIWVHPRTLELWERIGVTDRATDRGVLVDRIEIHRDGEHRSTVWYDGTGLTDHTRGVMLEQAVTQRLLLEALADLGVTPQWRTEVVGVGQDDHGVTVEVDTRDGRDTLRAGHLVGADGASSTVRTAIGLSLEGETYDSAFHLADVVVDTPLDHDRAHLTLSGPHTVAWLPLAGEQRWRIVGNLTDQQQAPDGPGYGRELDVEEVSQLIAPVGLDLEIRELQWATTYRSHHRLAPRYRVGRVLLAGDAAHLHSPAGGLGMNTGIGDAANLAWKLAAVVTGQTDPSLLDTYEQERRPVAKRVLATSDQLFSLQADTDGPAAALRPLLFPLLTGLVERSTWARRQLYLRLSALETSYAGTGMAAHADGRRSVRPGDRLPWAELADGRSSHELLDDRAHTLLHVGAGGASATDVDVRVGSLPIEVVEVRDDALLAAVGASRAEDVVVLVRPDRHVAELGIDAVRSYLARWQRRALVTA